MESQPERLSESPKQPGDIQPDQPTYQQPAIDTDPQSVNFDELTVAQYLGHLVRSPRRMIVLLTQILRSPATGNMRPSSIVTSDTGHSGRFLSRPVAVAHVSVPIDQANRQREMFLLGIRLTAVLIVLYGSGILVTERTEEFGLNVGAPYLLVGFVLWMFSELYASWPALRGWWLSRRRADPVSPHVGEPSAASTAIGTDWRRRLIFAVGGVATSLLTLAFTVGNRFRPEGVVTWVVSVALWVLVVAPPGWRPALLRSPFIRISRSPTFWTLAAIMVVGAVFRLYDLGGVPPQMTSDHVEKILDSQSILDGLPQVFFPNNGGREPIQFYLMAGISRLPGLGMNFLTLKLLTVIEGLVTIPLVWWMGREIIGKDEPEVGNAVGLILAALVAVSYWHVVLSRLGLRIVLTTLFAALLMVFIARALRSNRRSDFIKAGLVLGMGLYAYQAVRMLPVVILVGVAIAIVFRWLRARQHKARDAGILRMLLNFMALVVVSTAIFVPLLGFWIQYPGDFWRRTSGRLLGDDLIQTMNDQGQLVERVATLDERLNALRTNLPILVSNIRNAFLMFNWKGDVAWISAAPNAPQMDMFSGSFLIVGVAAWLARMLRRRDPVDWLILPMIFIMLLPSALSIAYPVENPSATRTSGAIPPTYLLAALPLAMLATGIKRLIAGRSGTSLAGGVIVLVLGLGLVANWSLYFGEYRRAYQSSMPAAYSDAGRYLRGFADSGGSYGNAFMIAYPYWWDHRALGLEAGLTDWPNGIVTRDDIPRFVAESLTRSDRYRLDPEKEVLFFYSPADEESDRLLKEWFPGGYSQMIPTSKPGSQFMVYRVLPGMLKTFLQ